MMALSDPAAPFLWSAVVERAATRTDAVERTRGVPSLMLLQQQQKHLQQQQGRQQPLHSWWHNLDPCRQEQQLLRHQHLQHNQNTQVVLLLHRAAERASKSSSHVTSGEKVVGDLDRGAPWSSPCGAAATTEDNNTEVLQLLGDAERGSSSSNSSLPLIIETSNDSSSDSEHDGDWAELTLDEPDQVQHSTSPSLPQQYQKDPHLVQANVVPISAPRHRQTRGSPRKGVDVVTNAVGELHRRPGPIESLPIHFARPPAARQEQRQRQQSFSFVRSLATSFRRRILNVVRTEGREKLVGPAEEEAGNLKHETTAAAAAVAAETPAIVALQMELLHLSREERRQRSRNLKTLKHRSLAATSSDSSTSDSSSTSVTPGTGSSSSCSNGCASSGCNRSVKWQPWSARLRFLSYSSPSLRCRVSRGTRQLRRCTSAPSFCVTYPSAPFTVDERERLHAGSRQTSPATRFLHAADGVVLSPHTARHRRARNHRNRGAAAVPLVKTGTVPSRHSFARAAVQDPPCVQYSGGGSTEGGTALASAAGRGRAHREKRALNAAAVLQQERERQDLQRSVLWWFAHDILMPYASFL